MFPRRVSSAVAATSTSTRRFTYQPPGSSAGGRRLPWQQPHSASAPQPRRSTATVSTDGSPLLSQVLNPAPRSVEKTRTEAPSIGASAGPSRATAAHTQVVSSSLHGMAVPSVVSQTSSQTASSATTSSSGGLRHTGTLRMPVLPGPTLDTRIEDIVKTEETVASEPLPKVVQLLIDPEASNVERITMADFVAMQPKRQLLALGGKKSWLEWLQNSPYYQQVARLTTDSPAHDLQALHQAGLHTLYQWAEQPNLVHVSPRTRSALNAAVQHSVTTFMEEVARVVNISTHHKHALDQWLSDVVGQFVLDSLGIRVETASAAMWEQRGNGVMPCDVHLLSHDGTGRAGEGQDGTNVMRLLLGDDAPHDHAGRRKSRTSSSAAAATTGAGGKGSATLLPAGECCTLEHYCRFVQKVVSSVRKDMQKRNGNNTSSGSGGGRRGDGSESVVYDSQSEMEIAERSNALIATALTQLLEQASQTLPEPLQALHHGGYLALGRVPELLKSAMTMLNVRDLPVRFFVLHSTADSESPLGHSTSTLHANSTGGDALAVEAPSFVPGVFLTGTANMDVTLKDWAGSADQASGAAGTTAVASVSPSSSSSAHQNEDPVVAEYTSVLHRLHRHVTKLSMTSLYELMQAPEQYGGYGFNAAEALGMDQLFGAAKLVEDRLASVLSYPAAAVRKPFHVLEAGYTSGKTAVLERLAAHRVRPGERAVVVRYKAASTPFVPDLDDHPIAFPSRFWFRAALATCPYFVHTEELFSRAPRSVMWWGNERNWTWSSYQRLILSSPETGADGAVRGSTEKLTAVLVDDFDVVLDAMESKWGDHTVANSAATVALNRVLPKAGSAAAAANGTDEDGARPSEEDVDWLENSPEVGEKDATQHNNNNNNTQQGQGESVSPVAVAHGLLASNPESDLAAAITAEQRQLARARWTAVTGKPFHDVLSNCFGKITIALGRVNLIVTGHHISPLLLTHSNGVPCQRYYLPFSSGVGLQQRLRVLPLMSALHAFHLYHGLELSGVLYEVLKNLPALTGKVLELFWTGRIKTMNLRLGAARGWGPRRDGSVPLLRGYALSALFEGLPERDLLFANPRRERTRLIQLLQRQVCHATGFLHTGVDTTRLDDRDGLVLPHHSTMSQVSPFALFLTLSRVEELETIGGSAAEMGGASGLSLNASGGAREKRIVRAWAEVWTQYAYVVGMMATIPERKREAMRVLLQGVMLLRASSVAGVELELNLKVPAYGFPLLATDTGLRHVRHDLHSSPSSASALEGGVAGAAQAHPLSAQTVGKAVSAYRSFFASASQSHFSFLPLPGRNAGCDIVMLAGSTIYFYDVITTVEERSAAAYRFAETLLGMLHVLEKQVLPADKVRHLHYVSVISLDHQSTRPKAQTGSVASHDLYRSNAAFASAAPYYMDTGSLFEDSVLDRLRLLQEPLGLGKKTFRTLNDLIDELQRAFHVRVRHDFCVTQEELESLFTPTLLQLVPDATVLPAYQSPVVTAEALMMKAMFELGGAEDGDNDAAEDALILDAEDEGMRRGAEVEDLRGDALLARDRSASAQLQRDVLGADNEALHESAALLEVMMNDELDLLTGATERQQRANAATATDLRNDFTMENNLNYHVDAPTVSGVGAHMMGSPSSNGHQNNNSNNNNNSSSSHSHGAQKSSGEDSLAWLHDILTPDTLMSGLHGGNVNTSGAAGAAGSGHGAQAQLDSAAAAQAGRLGSSNAAGALFSRFGEPLESTSSTFGLPIPPSADNWLQRDRNGALENKNSPGQGEAEEEQEGADDDDDDNARDGLEDEEEAPATQTSPRKKASRRPAKKNGTKAKTSGRGAGRGHRRGSAADAEGDVVTLEDLLLEVGRRNASSARKTRGKAAKANKTTRGGGKASAASSAASRRASAKKKRSDTISSRASAASAKRKVKAAAAAATATHKSSGSKTKGKAAASGAAQKKKKSSSARRR